MADRPVFHDSEPGTFATLFSEAAEVGDPAVHTFVSIFYPRCEVACGEGGEHTEMPSSNTKDTRHDSEQNLDLLSATAQAPSPEEVKAYVKLWILLSTLLQTGPRLLPVLHGSAMFESLGDSAAERQWLSCCGPQAHATGDGVHGDVSIDCREERRGSWWCELPAS
jgi:hypothetical protein